MYERERSSKMAEQSTAMITGGRFQKRRVEDKVIHAAQCGECFKWRVIPTREEFEDIRSKLIDEAFICSKKKGSSCEEPGDIDYDSSRVWGIEKPGLPKTPAGFKIQILLRKNMSKFDTYYITPTGEKLRAPSGIASYLKEHPEYKDEASVSDFNFSSPKIMADTVPYVSHGLKSPSTLCHISIIPSSSLLLSSLHFLLLALYRWSYHEYYSEGTNSDSGECGERIESSDYTEKKDEGRG